MLKIVQKLSWLQHCYMCISLGQMACFSLVTTNVTSKIGLLHYFLAINCIKVGNKIFIIILAKQIKIDKNAMVR